MDKVLVLGLPRSVTYECINRSGYEKFARMVTECECKPDCHKRACLNPTSEHGNYLEHSTSATHSSGKVVSALGRYGNSSGVWQGIRKLAQITTAQPTRLQFSVKGYCANDGYILLLSSQQTSKKPMDDLDDTVLDCCMLMEKVNALRRGHSLFYPPRTTSSGPHAPILGWISSCTSNSLSSRRNFTTQ